MERLVLFPKKTILGNTDFSKTCLWIGVLVFVNLVCVFFQGTHNWFKQCFIYFHPLWPFTDTILFVSCFRRIKIVPFIKCHLYYEKIIILICLIHLYYETNIVLQIS
jgi:hypothetical protein